MMSDREPGWPRRALELSVLSDLRLETGSFSYDPGDADLAVFAGDIHEREKGLDWMLALGLSIPVIYVVGNHEFYKTSYPALIEKLRRKARGSNIHVLDNESLTIDGVRFHGVTLWTDYRTFGDPVASGQLCQTMMSDHRYIRRLPGYSKVRSVDLARLHHAHVSWLRQSLAESDDYENVVVTHHAPSPRSLRPSMRDDASSAAYASDLEPFIKEYKPGAWIHGHCHNSSDYSVGRSRVICNPRGYYPDELNTDFNGSLCIEIGG
ncbi:MAG: metallophosphoesterase [Alcanivoracaceae bacterium]|jgi:predicted phosphohydrolase|nr:metallophosphoesterase [Alcanivoracaceae bacterium]